MTASERPESTEAKSAAAGELDAGTLERARRKDLGAFEQLHRAYVGRVYALCLRLCADAGRAEDLVQEVFLRVWQKIDSYEGRSRFSTWLYRLAVNRVTDVMRVELRRSLQELPEALAEERAAVHRESQARLDLETAIRALPPGARLVFVLHDVEGYSHEDIAEMIGISAGTSKSQLHRARRLLRERLSR
jgi:RNA polymerase sigma-70 factor (ECF subfamily)